MSRAVLTFHRLENKGVSTGTGSIYHQHCDTFHRLENKGVSTGTGSIYHQQWQSFYPCFWLSRLHTSADTYIYIYRHTHTHTHTHRPEVNGGVRTHDPVTPQHRCPGTAWQGRGQKTKDGSLRLLENTGTQCSALQYTAGKGFGREEGRVWGTIKWRRDGGTEREREVAVLSANLNEVLQCWRRNEAVNSSWTSAMFCCMDDRHARPSGTYASLSVSSAEVTEYLLDTLTMF